MNEIVKDEIKVYEMMQEHKRMSRETAKEVLRMDLEVRKKLNKLSKKNKEVEVIKLIKQLNEIEQDALYELEKLVYNYENKEKMTKAEKDLLKVFLKYSI